MRKVMASLVALVASAVTANAGPINYNEAVSGDLPTSGFPLPTFVLDVGTNTVRGNFGWVDSTGSVVDFDSFAFLVQPGQRITSANVQLVDAQGDLIGSIWNYRSGSANYETGTLLEVLNAISPGTFAFTSTPNGAGLYNISTGRLTDSYRSRLLRTTCLHLMWLRFRSR
jgi:hypothetical protein